MDTMRVDAEDGKSLVSVPVQKSIAASNGTPQSTYCN
jgi:hypothetical protein